MRSIVSISLIVAALAVALPVPASAQVRPSLTDSFPLGSEGTLLCRVQSRLGDPALESMFDRGYAIVCRDAAAAVGHVYALREQDEPAARLAAGRAGSVTCPNAAGPADVEGLAGARVTRCTLADSPVNYSVYEWSDGETLYAAQGLAGYDSALKLALRSIVADRVLPGELAIATTQAGDPSAFAGVQAGSLDEDLALTEAYRRNNSGNYAEAAEFFETLTRRALENGQGDATERAGEFLINHALQQSNLGNFDEAEAIYQRALRLPIASPTQLRLRRNFRALHLMNQRRFDAALGVLDEPLEASMSSGEQIADAVISSDTANEINSSYDMSRELGGEDSERLTNTERAVILDAQARQLRGTILRLTAQPDQAIPELRASIAAVQSVRNGRVRSTARLRAQALTELALIAEERGDAAGAGAQFAEAMALMQTQYPSAIATSAAEARYAAWLARRDRRDEAIALFEKVVADNSEQAPPRAGLENRLEPYFALLLDELGNNPSLVNQFFLASETLVRPGVANTQAVLARELSGGNDEAARLFRQSVTLQRSVESNLVELARLRGVENPDAVVTNQIAIAESELSGLQAEQTATQASLGAFPRYRAISTSALTLADLQSTLREGEAYLKLAEVAGDIYAIYATPEFATAYRADLTAAELAEYVQLLRDTIAVNQDGQVMTYPFDVGLSYYLYTKLMGPVGDRMEGVSHLIFEPDGAMLELPANLLVTDEAGVRTYEAHTAQGTRDPFDFTGIAWLGRNADVSTAVSARSFRDLRNLAPSGAPREFIGFGQNQEPPARIYNASYRDPAADRCAWPIAAWFAPIQANELFVARRIVGGAGSEVITGPDFTDTAIGSRSDLDQYRIVHFATHGLVTQPAPECPANPALLTSFGPPEQSDGLLSFAEIFDMRLDADLVILSACDTASAAGIAASRQAGLSGGTSALDGLVRAFVGAGSRVVIASHWPAPDDYNATQRLITGLFEQPAGTGIGTALRTAQRALMDDPETSHPYYWSGFAVVGDGTRPVVRTN